MPNRDGSDGDESDSDHDSVDAADDTAPATADESPAPEPSAGGVAGLGLSGELAQAREARDAFEAMLDGGGSLPGSVGTMRRPPQLADAQWAMNELASAVQPVSTPATSGPLRRFQQTARAVAARQSEFSAAFRASMAAPAALAGLAAVTEPTMTVSPAVDPALVASVVGPHLQETATAIQAVGPLASAALPSVEPLLAAVRQPAFQQLVQLVGSLATIPVSEPAAMLDQQTLRQTARLLEQLEVISENLSGVAAPGVGAVATQPAGQTGAAEAAWSATPESAQPAATVDLSTLRVWAPDVVVGESLEGLAIVVRYVLVVAFLQARQAYPDQQLELTYLELATLAFVELWVWQTRRQ